MSDFDKEAERERLREKYADEAEEREATQQMSELLLKGATMTNKHCGRCGDPIFRHDGQEFCPSCNAGGQQGATEGGQSANDQTEGDATASAEEAPNRPGAEPATQTKVDTATQGQTEPSVGGANADAQTPAEPRAPQSDVDSPQRPTAGTPQTGPADSSPSRDVPGVAVDGDAVAQVEATVERFAAAAASTDDPERARECLAVVREAAETLRVLRADQR